MSGRRLSSGGLLDRNHRLSFSFDGTHFTGFKGDTLASALLANGVRVVGRSFKYHRPRGVWGAWVDEPNAFMTVRLRGREMPNCSATTTYLEDGMEARAVNAWPSAKLDVKGGLDWFHRFLGAGFYYKTFIWPDWHLFEPSIRKMAGLGAVSRDQLEDFTADQVHGACDVLVVGGGPSGLAAARVAAEAGEDVVLVEDHPELGGSAYQMGTVEGVPAGDWVAVQRAAILSAGGRILTRTTAFGVYDHKLVACLETGGFGEAPRLWRIRAARTVLATGAIDRPLTFAQNDVPGVMSLFGAAEYAARFGVLVGDRLAVVADHSMADGVVDILTDAGARVRKVNPADGPLKARGGHWLTGLNTGDQTISADTVLASGGLTPLVHLWRHAGGKLDWCDKRQAFLPGNAPAGMSAVGAANGTFDLDAALHEARTGERAETTYHVTPHWPDPDAKGRQWIDFQHDVTLKDIAVAAAENYTSVEHLKRYTTLGMAVDQGKTSNMAGLAAMASLRGVTIPEVGTTTFRPPFVPVPLETYHGIKTKQLYHPIKRLVLEHRHRDADAALCEYGGWLRPGWYGGGTAMNRIQAEAQMVRDSVGLFDGSPLGKIEVMGPDAEAFVNFMFYNTMKTLKIGRIRYGFLLTEAGIVYDDGVVSRLGPDRFLISCSSSHVDGVRTHLEAWRQDGNDPDRIFVHDTTMHWATVTVSGPKARAVLDTLGLEPDLSNDALPHMSFVETRWRDVSLRIARVSFTGEVSFEISLPCGHAPALWDQLAGAVGAAGGGFYGIEASSILRAEKGYIIVGKDTDGETMPHDLGFGIPRAKKTDAYVGDRSLQTETAKDVNRKVLVGLRVEDGDPPLVTGSHVAREGQTVRSLGYVTSSYLSPTLGHPIALGIVEQGRERMGEQVTIWHSEFTRTATICDPCFYDPDGERLNA